MKPWMWGVLAAAVLIILVVVAWVLYGLQATPSPTPDPAPIDVPEPAADPTAVDVPEPVEPPVTQTSDDTDLPYLLDEDGRPIPGSGPGALATPDPAPEHINEATFNRMLDELIETCGLDGWSEMQRSCDDLQCEWVLAQAPDGAYPTPEAVVGCPVWKDNWGPSVEQTSTRVTCDDGVELEVVSLSPSTLRMRAAADEGAELIADRGTLREAACGSWGQ